MGRAALYLDNNFKTELLGAKVFKVEYRPSSRIIGAPVENGMTIFDNKVIDPPKIIVTLTIVKDSEYAQLARQAIQYMMDSRDIGKNNEKLYSASDGDECFNNLMLRDCVKVRETDKFDFLNYVLSFDKILVVQKSDGGLVGDKSNTQKNGHHQGTKV